MIKYIVHELGKYYNQMRNDITFKKLKIFKKSAFLYFNDIINKEDDVYTNIKVLRNLSVAELESESIVESICSSLKKIYRSERHRFLIETLKEMLKLRLSLPVKKKERDRVIKEVIDKYKELFPRGWIHKVCKRTKRRRRKKNGNISISKTVNRRRAKTRSAFTLPFD